MTLSCTRDEIEVSATTTQGHVTAALDGEVKGQDAAPEVNPLYLLEAAKSCPGEGRLILEIRGEEKPMVLYREKVADDGLEGEAWVMPIKA